MAAEHEWLTTAQVAAIFNVSANAVREWVDTELLRADVTPGGHRRIEAASVAELLPLLKIRPTKSRRAALEALRKHNRGEDISPES